MLSPDNLNHHALLHEDMKHFFSSFSGQAHPMAILSAMVASLSGYYGEALPSAVRTMST